MMLSRVADHQYWMSRQMERAENLARLVRVSEEMLLDDESLGRLLPRSCRLEEAIRFLQNVHRGCTIHASARVETR